jgi:subtilisin family serine protease
MPERPFRVDHSGMGQTPTRRFRTAFIAIAALALCGLPTAAEAAVTGALQTRLDVTAASQRVPVLVTLTDQVDAARFKGHPQALIAALKRESRQSRAQLDLDGPQRVTRFWLVNAISLTASPAQIARIAADKDVASVDLDAKVHAVDAEEAPDVQKSSGKGDWGVNAIGARSVWDAYGITGKGERIGVIDTGIDPANPDLAGKIAAWKDFVNGRATPYDDAYHGTHVAGTLVGGAVGGGAIGVAPGATLVVAKALSGQGSGDGSLLIAAAQWMMDPDGNPATADYPTVISNSWVSPAATDTWFLPMVRAWRALGIVPVFAAGNVAGAGTVGSPASYSESVAVGAVDDAKTLADFSSQGPITWAGVNDEGLAPGTVVGKPDFVAPGEFVMSSVPGGYAEMSGTSMAAPHVAGAVALLQQAAPGITVDQVIATLKATAGDLGAPGPDNQYGAGLVDVYSAVKSVLGAPPTTDLVKAPPSIVATNKVTFQLDSRGATAFRARVDAGTWSAPKVTTAMTLSLTSGRHKVQVQAVAANGYVDPQGITRIVIVDKKGPQVHVRKITRGGKTVLVAKIANAAWKVTSHSFHWSGGQRGKSAVCGARCPASVTVQDTTGARATTRIASALRG